MHWSDDDLIARLYGAGREDPHPKECPECRARWLKLRERREALLETPAIPARLLAEQRLAIEGRLARRARPLAGLAVAALLLLAVGLQKPAPEPPVDSQLFSDVFAEVARAEPRAIAPMHALFEVTP